MKTILSFFALLSASGLALSIASHIAALFNAQGPLGQLTPMLHVGIFFVWLPAIFVASRLAKNVPQKDFWKAATRGCPQWMRYMMYGFCGYAMLNFVIFVISAPKESAMGQVPASVVLGFSGHWMAFYSAALMILYSGTKLWDQEEPHCPNGHMVQPLAKFCDECGQPVIRALGSQRRD